MVEFKVELPEERKKELQESRKLLEDIKRELSQYHRDNHEEKCIYFSCNINGKRLVVSGPRNGALTIYQNITKDS